VFNVCLLTMPSINVNINDVPFDSDVLIHLWADGKGPNVSDGAMLKVIKSCWGQHDTMMRVETTSGDTVSQLCDYTYSQLRSMMPVSRKKHLRALCIYMCVFDELTLAEYDIDVSYPLDVWIAETLSGGFIPLLEVKEKIVCRLFKLVSNYKEEMAKTAVSKLRSVYKEYRELTDNVPSPVFAKLFIAFETAMVICDNFEKKQGEALLDQFNEELQDYYENKIELRGLGNVEADSKFLKMLFGMVKEVYENTPIVLKKKKEKKKKKPKKEKKASPPPIPPFPSKEKLASLGYEVIVWDGGDINETIVLVPGVF
jgi:hypothetical protein